MPSDSVMVKEFFLGLTAYFVRPIIVMSIIIMVIYIYTMYVPLLRYNY